MRNKLKKYIGDYYQPVEVNKKFLNRDYSFGYWVGEEISKNLPVPKTSILHTNNVVNISEEDLIENRRLRKIWEDKILEKKDDDSNDSWDNFNKHNSYIKHKYLDKKVSFSVNTKIKVNDINTFLKGVSESIWDSDLSYYKCKEEEIYLKITDEDFLITLFL